MKAGIIDATKVVRTALQNAASVASMLLTTEAMVAEKPEDKPAMPPMPRRWRVAWAEWVDGWNGRHDVKKLSDK